MRSETYIEARNKTVRKANELIQKSRFDLSLQQQKIMLYLISQISPYDDDFKLYEFPIQEFCRVCGINVSGKNYEDIKAAIKEIKDKSIWVRLDNGKDATLSWIEKAYIDPGSGIIQIRLDNDMKPFLLQLKANFTSYELIWTLRFRSKYAIRLYELIKSIHFHELEEYRRTYKLDELKALLGAETHKTYQHFRTRALVPAVDEINELSDKNVSFEAIKKGRAVDQISFVISSKNSLEAAKLRSEAERELGADQITIWETLESKGLV